jgi:hypothetical protein
MDNNAPNSPSQHAENTTMSVQDSEGILMDVDNAEKKRSLCAMMDADAPVLGDGGSVSTNDNFVRKAVGKDGEPLSEKKLRRLEKNRLSARECRRRKREATENMERQINLLEGENLRLRLQLQVCAVEHCEGHPVEKGKNDNRLI